MKSGTLKTISHSTADSYRKCPKYTKIVKILKIKDPNSRSIPIYQGKLLHEGIQNVLMHGQPEQEAADIFCKKWDRLLSLYKKYIDFSSFSPEKIREAAIDTIFSIKRFLKEKFGDFEVLAVEEKLEFKTKYPQKYVGYIDLVIKVKDQIHILDIKTANSVFYFNKYKDKYKDYQLTLYKIFYSKKHNIPKENIHTYFLILERQKSKSMISLERITSGKVKIANVINWLNRTLILVNKDKYPTNRAHCFAYGRECHFRRTKYCPLGK